MQTANRRSARRRGHYWPTPPHVQLLRAALLDGEAAREAWHGWRAAVDIERLDEGSERLLPLLAHNLGRLGIATPDLGRYGGILTYTLVTNRRRLVRLVPVLRALHAAGIPAMLLKGMGLALHHYAHMGLRPMADADLLVPVSHAGQATTILEQEGWRPSAPALDFSQRHSRLFVSPDGHQLDLHWHALWELSGGDDDEGPWARASGGNVEGVPVRVLAPDDMFLHVVVHGARWNAVPPVRWVADAATVLAAAGSRFDWHRLVTQARTVALVLPLRDGLAYSSETLGVRVPADVVAELATHHASPFESLEHRMRAWTSPTVGCFPLELCQHVRLTRRHGLAAMVFGLPGHLRRAYGWPTVAALLPAAVRRAVRRLRTGHAPSA